MGGTGHQLIFKCSEIFCSDAWNLLVVLRSQKKNMYTCSGEEKEKNVESNYTFSCHATKIKVLQGSVLNDFSKNG